MLNRTKIRKLDNLFHVLFVMSAIFLTIFLTLPVSAQTAFPAKWANEFPLLNSSQALVDFADILDDGNTRDSIPPIYEPIFIPAANDISTGRLEPVISLNINGDARAYPVSVLLWHEIVNDVVGGVPIVVTYCPLCNSGVVFDRRLNGETLLIGNSGRIRKYDMILFDHQSESWWQQISGEAIIGDQVGQSLTLIAARLESLDSFVERNPEGLLLIPNNPQARPYGTTPFAGLERRTSPIAGLPNNLPEGVGPFDYVVMVGDEAWPLKLVQAEGALTSGDLEISWTKGRNSIHSTEIISQGSDLGNVVVTRNGEDVPYDMIFAFAFDAFVPDGHWHFEI